MTLLQGPEDSQEKRLTDMIRRYEKDILRLCYMYLHDVDLAKDAVQDTFLKAYVNLNRQEDPAKEKNWLVTIAVNVCRDYLRSSWFRRINHHVRPEELPVAVNPPDEERILLTASIMNLPPKYSEVIILRYVHGLDLQETSSVLGITPSAVSRRCRKACQKLKSDLKGDGIDDE